MQEQIVIVDGFAIRNTLDTEFDIFRRYSTNILDYARAWYIPQDELWVDEPYIDELSYLLEVDKFFHGNNIGGGALERMSYKDARIAARKKFGSAASGLKIERRQEKHESGLMICYIDGGLVRRHIDPEFSFGGHEFVYDYVPKNEVWVDDKIAPEEQPFVLLHELVERDVMQEGANYDSGHDLAVAHEKNARRDAGFGRYPGDANYPWCNLSNEDIIKRYVKRRFTNNELERQGIVADQ